MCPCVEHAGECYRVIVFSDEMHIEARKIPAERSLPGRVEVDQEHAGRGEQGVLCRNVAVRELSVDHVESDSLPDKIKGGSDGGDDVGGSFCCRETVRYA